MSAGTEYEFVPDPLTVTAINGGAAANDDIRIQGTTNATRTTSFLTLQENGGLVGVGKATPTVPLDVVGATMITATTDGAEILRVNNADGTRAFCLGTVSGAPTFYTMWVGNITPSGSNYTLQKYSGGTVFNDPTQFEFRINAGFTPMAMVVSATGVTIAAGGSASTVKVGGTLTTDTTQTGNITTGEDTLQTYSLPAGTLSVNGYSTFLKVVGTIANNANAKRIRVKFGATTIFDTGAAGIAASNAMDWSIEAQIIRTGAATQKCIVTAVFGVALVGVPSVDYTTAAETLSGAVTILVTGEATNTNDIVKEAFKASFEP